MYLQGGSFFGGQLTGVVPLEDEWERTAGSFVHVQKSEATKIWLLSPGCIQFMLAHVRLTLVHVHFALILARAMSADVLILSFTYHSSACVRTPLL